MAGTASCVMAVGHIVRSRPGSGLSRSVVPPRLVAFSPTEAGH